MSRKANVVATMLLLATWLVRAVQANGQATTFGPPGTDLHGDPLPRGAIARLGTTRLRNAFLGPHFLPDGKTLLTANRHAVQFWETMTGRLLREIAVDSFSISGVHLKPDGRTLEVSGSVIGETPERSEVRIWDLASGKQIRTLSGVGRPRSAEPWAVTPDGKLLATMDGDILQLVELPSERKRPAIDTGKKRIGHTTLTFSHDGKVLAVADLGNRRGLTGGLFLWDMAGNRFSHEFITPGEQVYQVAFTSDDRLVAATTTEGVHVWEVRNGRALGELAGAHRSSLRGLAVGRAGVVATASFDHTARIWDTGTGRQTRKLQHDAPLSALALSPDGKVLATSSSSMAGTIFLWNLHDGKQMKRLAGDGAMGALRGLQFAPDGRKLLSWDYNGTLRIWDTRGDKIVAEHTVPSFVGRPATELDRQAQRHLLALRGMKSCCFSPNGKYLTLSFFDTFRIYATGTGREWQTIPNPAFRVRFMSASFDSRSFAAVSGKGKEQKQVAFVWELATGKLRRSFDLPDKESGPVAFSADGRYLAVGRQQLPGEIRLLSLATGKTVATLAGFRGQVTGLAFSPDNAFLVSALDDTSALVWRVAPANGEPVEELGPKSLDRLWQELASVDAARAYQASWALVRSPTTSLRFLRANLQPSAAAHPARLAQLLRDLNSDRFAVRQKASRSLEELGGLAEASLKAALAAKPPLEQRRRIDRLLRKLEDPVTSPATLRQMRAVETLEHIGNAAAKSLLNDLARGAPAARLTLEAKESLTRLSVPR